MPSKFVIQVVEVETGQVVQWAPGMAVERQLVEDLCSLTNAKIEAHQTQLVEDFCARVRAQGVGMWRTEAHVLDDIRNVVQEALPTVKAMLGGMVRLALTDLLHALKSDVTPSTRI